MNFSKRVCAKPENGIKMNPKREVRTPKFKMRVVGAGRGKGSYKRHQKGKKNLHLSPWYLE